MQQAYITLVLFIALQLVASRYEDVILPRPPLWAGAGDLRGSTGRQTQYLCGEWMTCPRTMEGVRMTEAVFLLHYINVKPLIYGVPNPKTKCFSSHLAVVCVQYTEAMC